MPDRRRVIVLGGGITGLAAAWRLHQTFEKSAQPLSLLLLEASSGVGGSLQTEYRDGFTLERGPDCFISQKPRGVALVRELGLESELIGTKPDDRRSFIYRNGRFHPVPEGFYLLGPSKLGPFLQSQLLSWRGKWRTLAEPLIPARKMPSPCPLPGGEGRSGLLPLGEGAPRADEGYDESLGSFVRRRLGPEMLDWLAQPLLGGIYGADPERLSLRATFPQFQEMEEKYGSILLGLKKRDLATKKASGARYSLFVSMKRGLQTLTGELEKRLGPTVVRRNAKVSRLTPTPLPEGEGGRRPGEAWNIHLANGEVLSADSVVSALPSYTIAELVRPFDQDLATDLDGIAYAPAVTINFAFRQMDVGKTFPGIGFVVPHKEGKAVMGCTNVQNKFDGRVPKGFVLLRAFIGGVLGSHWTDRDDEALTKQALKELHEMLEFSAKPLFGLVSRYTHALPQYEVGHVERILRIQERVLRWKGLTLAGNWQHGVGIPDCIESAERAVQSVL
jgi:protoporphyrinogen/coproporphyrinogen III oxidase